MCLTINKNKHQSLYFKKKSIEQVKNIIFFGLGLHLNENLSWKPHVLTLFKKLRRNIALMHKLTFYLNKTNLLNVYYSLIVSHLRYAAMAEAFLKWGGPKPMTRFSSSTITDGSGVARNFEKGSIISTFFPTYFLRQNYFEAD